jgi:hypothetical protein
VPKASPRRLIGREIQVLNDGALEIASLKTSGHAGDFRAVS